MRSRPVPPDTKAAQASATDPAASAWVTANAGAGKTYVLARRVVRLLLEGADPATILCLTFTRAAAAEMAQRVFATLAGWATVAETGLAAALHEIDGKAPDSGRIAAARRLFAAALETPGGLKIQTIHSFCERLLHQFPFEANVPGQFKVLDDLTAAELIAQSRAAALIATADEDSPLGNAWRALIDACSDHDIEAALSEAIARRYALRQWITQAGDAPGEGSLDNAIALLRHRLGLGESEDAATVLGRFLADAPIQPPDWRRLLDALAANPTGNNSKAALEVECILAAADPQSAFQARYRFAISAKGEPRRWPRRVTKAVAGALPEFENLFDRECAALQAVREKLNCVRTVKLTAALLTVFDAILAHYETAKARRGLLDFDDLIQKTASLLLRVEAAQWVLYKLDSGLNHILVDEAQDTNPQQWQVIKALAEAFFAGDPESQAPRTVFAVGDEKQSIFSFQGADMRELQATRRHFDDKVSGTGQNFRPTSLRLSFRSAPEILSAVDKVFARNDLRASIVTDPAEGVDHEAWKSEVSGRVEIWARTSDAQGDEPDAWETPQDAPGSGTLALASKIADEIERYRAGELGLSGGMASMGEVIILVRRRGTFVAAMNAELKRRGLPAAGADRIALSSHIAVLDLLALGDVVLLPQDDLALAALLKSPLIGLDENDLFALAHGRDGSLWAALEKSGKKRHQAAFERLTAWRADAERMTPMAFFARVLGPDGGRRRVRARLGGEADEVIDTFLSQALAYEQSHTPTLQGFLNFVRASPGDIKREGHDSAGAIRVMTVHGAKGLEADIVFLVDDGGKIVNENRRPYLLPVADRSGLDKTPARSLRQKTEFQTAAQANAVAVYDADQVDEYRRLLYVGMTRPRERLYITGISRPRTPPDSWYGLVRSALVPVSKEGEDGELTEPVVFGKGANPPVGQAKAPKTDNAVLPHWLNQPAPPAARPPAPLRPSQALAEPDPPGPDGGVALSALPQAAGAIVRGRLVHTLLERLPDLRPAERPAAAEAILAGETSIEARERLAIIDEAFAVIHDPRLAVLFGPQSRAEVAIAGNLRTVAGAFAVSGRIDRLAISGEAVLVADFKTDRHVPARPEDTNPAYILQMALYRRLLAESFAGRPINAFLIWTAEPRITELPVPLLDAALAARGLAGA